MLSQEENDLLTRTGPGTPMGELFRRYWVPALLSEELPESDCAPVRVRILGEELLAFRDTDGRVGLVDRYCPHRGASLFFGRNEQRGIRCVYHGWKYDVAGSCIEMPSEPEARVFKENVRLKSYPCRERGSLVWAYMGPRDRMPGLPELEWALVPDGQRCISKRLQDCNYLQALEGGVDLSHISFLHRNLDSGRDKRGQQLVGRDTTPNFEIVHTDGGLLIAARRSADSEHDYWRISQWLSPWYTMFPPLVDTGIGGHAWVPIDDEHCWAYSVNWHPMRPISVEEWDGDPMGGIHTHLMAGTRRPRANKDNDYLVDRTAQRTRSFTGIAGFAAQDCAVQESMGPICDRTRERLGPSDIPIMAVRRRLMEAVRAVEAGVEPPGVDPASHRVRPAALLLPKSVSFQEGAREALMAEPGRYVAPI